MLSGFRQYFSNGSKICLSKCVKYICCSTLFCDFWYFVQHPKLSLLQIWINLQNCQSNYCSTLSVSTKVVSAVWRRLFLFSYFIFVSIAIALQNIIISIVAIFQNHLLRSSAFSLKIIRGPSANCTPIYGFQYFKLSTLWIGSFFISRSEK